MLYLAILCGMLLTGTAVLLWRRVERGCREARRLLSEGGPTTPYLDALARCVQQTLDESLLARVGVMGLSTVPLRYREHQDPYGNVAELLADIARKARDERTVPYEALIKATYQLSYTLDIPLERVDACLDILIRSLQSATAPRPIICVQRIGPGEMVDTRTMVPLNYGPRVVYPMGVVTFDADGKVVSRARIICS